MGTPPRAVVFSQRFLFQFSANFPSQLARAARPAPGRASGLGRAGEQGRQRQPQGLSLEKAKGAGFSIIGGRRLQSWNQTNHVVDGATKGHGEIAGGGQRISKSKVVGDRQRTTDCRAALAAMRAKNLPHGRVRRDGRARGRVGDWVVR